MSIPWQSFEEYLSSMRSGYRRQILATLRARERERLRIRVVDHFGDECPRVVALYEQVMDRAQFQLERLNLAFFRNIATYLPGSAGAILVERDDELLAAAVLLRSPRLLTFFMAGIEYGRNRACSAYLNLVAEIVAEAIRSRVEGLELGQTSPELKARLGAVAVPRYLYLRCPSPLAHAVLRSASGMLFPAAPVPRRRVFRPPAVAA